MAIHRAIKTINIDGAEMERKGFEAESREMKRGRKGIQGCRDVEV
jgi:hypothetical protein